MKNLSSTILAFLVSMFSLTAQSGDVYNFDHEVKMELKQFEDENVEGNQDFNFLLSEGSNVMGFIGAIEQQGQKMEAKAVLDMDQNMMTMLMDQGGMKMAIKRKMETEKAEQRARADSEASIEKTGRTKSILGYKCEEYEITDGENYSQAWISDEVDLPNYYEAYSSMSDRKIYDSDMPQGFLMEMNTWPNGKGSDEKYAMTVTEINKNKNNKISTEGYRVMQMPGGR